MSVRGFFKEAAKFAGAGLQSGVRTGMKTYETGKKIEAEEKRLGFEEARVKHEKDKVILEGRRVKEVEEAGKSTRETEAIQRDILRLEKEIKQILDGEGVTPNYIIQTFKQITDLAERDTDKLRSLESLAKIAGLFETEKKREELTVFAGFTEEQMKVIGNGTTKKLKSSSKES